MGAGASADASGAAKAATDEELKAALESLSEEGRAKLRAAVESATEADKAVSEAAPEVQEVKVELSFVVDELFRCFDSDLDGLIGREEFLDCSDKIATILDDSFGPKQRKVKMQWYKDAGAEGTPTDGMFLSKDKWQTALLTSSHAESEIPTEECDKVASWIWKCYGKQLVDVCFPQPKADIEAGADVPNGPKPEYPLKVPLTELGAKLEEAKRWGLRALILANKCPEVETFLQYQIPENLTIDSAQVFLAKTGDVKATLCRGMDYMGLCGPVHIKMADGCFNWVKYCCDDFPAEVFNGSLWTLEVAHSFEFISEGMKAKLESDPQRWKDFTFVISSTLSLDDANAKLADKIPHFDRLAIIEIDPDSIAKG